MTKGKKLLSLFLALVMAFSTLSAALVVFATAEDELTEKINTLYDEVGGNINSKTDEAKVSEFKEIAAEYKALTDAEKNDFSMTATAKIFELAYETGYYLEVTGSVDAKKVAADSYAKDLLGRTAEAEAAKTYFETLSKATVSVGGKTVKLSAVTAANITSDTDGVIAKAFEEQIKAYKELDVAERRYLPMLEAGSKGDVFYTNGSRATGALVVFFNYFKAVKAAEVPFTETAPDYKDTEKYPDGRKDEQYIKDKAVYDDNSAKAMSVWCGYAWQEILKVESELLQSTFDAGKAMADVLIAYVEDAESVSNDQINSAYEEYEALSDTDSYFFGKTSSMFYTYIKYLPDQYASSRCLAFPAIANVVKGLVGQPRLDAFIAAVNEATEPYSADEINKAVAAYKEVLPESIYNIPDEVFAKFEDMIASMPASEEKPVLPDWTRPDLNYPILTCDKSLAFLVKILDKLANGAFVLGGYSDLNDLLAKELYTNATIASIPQTLYPMLEQLLNDNGAGMAVSFLKISPEKLADVMDEEKFAAARDLFKSLTPEGGKDATANWANLDITKVANGTFGFQDGDREGFVNALASVLRGVTVPLATNPVIKVQFANMAEQQNGSLTGNYTYGLYEYLIPVLEALDLEGLISSREYTANFEAAQGNAKADTAILPILNPIFDLVENKLAADPVSTIVDLLPKVAHVLNDGILNEQLKLLHGTLGIIGNFVPEDALNIDPSAIIGLVNGLIGNLKIGDVTLSLKLSDIDWELLASVAKPVVKASVSGENAYRVGFETNKGDSFLLIYRYLFNNLTEQNNMASIKAAVKALVKDFVLSNILGQTLTTIEGMSADEALVMTCQVLEVPEFPEEPDPEETTSEETTVEETTTEETTVEETTTEETTAEETTTEETTSEETTSEETTAEETKPEDTTAEATEPEDTTAEATEAPATEAPATEAPSTEEAPANGDTMMIGAFAAVAVLAGAALIITKKRK